jgi:Lrp/AsnC family transcriptional regulator, leucine-responsive regulatory protein
MIESEANDRHIGGGRDAIDDKLIALLRRNARMTLTALSSAVSLSRTAVQARIARLEREGVIVGYQAILGDTRSKATVGAVLSITFSQRPCAPVVAKFRHWPEIEAYYSVTGPIDAYMVVQVDTTQALAGLVHKLSATPGVAMVYSAVII